MQAITWYGIAGLLNLLQRVHGKVCLCQVLHIWQSQVTSSSSGHHVCCPEEPVHHLLQVQDVALHVDQIGMHGRALPELITTTLSIWHTCSSSEQLSASLFSLLVSPTPTMNSELWRFESPSEASEVFSDTSSEASERALTAFQALTSSASDTAEMYSAHHNFATVYSWTSWPLPPLQATKQRYTMPTTPYSCAQMDTHDRDLRVLQHVRSFRGMPQQHCKCVISG